MSEKKAVTKGKKSEKKKSPQKIFVLDTNVLIHDPNAMHHFFDNIVVFPITVIEELDDLKKGPSDINRGAREAVRLLERLRKGGGSLCSAVGVKTPKGGIVRVDLNHKDALVGKICDKELEKADYRILSVAYALHQQEKEKGKKGKEVWFISQDINARLKGDSLGLNVDEYIGGRVQVDKSFTGWRDVSVSNEAVNKFRQTSNLSLKTRFYPNEFVHLINKKNPQNNCVVRYDGVKQGFVKLNDLYNTAYSMTGLNFEQKLALQLLLDPDIPLVTLIGKAGTGKTLLALAAALQGVERGEYTKILVTRPIIPMGKDIGFVPGDKDEKLRHWMQPIFDNLGLILSQNKPLLSDSIANVVVCQKGKRSGSGNSDTETINFPKRVEDLIGDGKIIELEALTYIRGRSIPNQYVIVDEAQNLTPHEVKTIVSRAGEGTKVVLTGDPGQIDNPYLDATNNGMVYVVEKSKTTPLAGHVDLPKTERSPLASWAAENL